MLGNTERGASSPARPAWSEVKTATVNHMKHVSPLHSANPRHCYGDDALRRLMVILYYAAGAVVNTGTWSGLRVLTGLPSE